MLKFSYLGGPQTPFSLARRTMSSVPLVCRKWYHVAVPFLYSSVVVRRFPAVALLSRTLSSEPARFGPLVRRLTFACPMYDDSSPTDDIEDIIERCQALRCLSFEGLADMHNFQCQLVLQCQEDSAAEDTCEEDEDAGKPYTIRTILLPSSTLGNIRSLSVHLNYTEVAGWEEPLVFPRLETLVLWFQRDRSLSGFPDPWVTPALKDLRFRPTLCAPSVSGLLSFLKPREDRLESLDFGTRSGFFTYKAHSLDAVERVVKRCRNLQHIVFQLLSAEEVRTVAKMGLFSHSLKSVDIVALGRMCSHPPFTIRQGSAWERVRYFDRALLDLFPDIAHILPPAEDDLEDMDFYGYKIKRQGAWVYNDDIFGTAPREIVPCCCSEEGSEDADAEDDSETSSSDDSRSESAVEDGSDSDSDYVLSESDSDNWSEHNYVSDLSDSNEREET